MSFGRIYGFMMVCRHVLAGVEFERFQRLTGGREFKMIELKKAIEYLRMLGSGDGASPIPRGDSMVLEYRGVDGPRR